MASVAERKGQFTFDDFLLLVKEYQKADLLDGVIYMASPESTDDNRLGGWLYRLMSEYVSELDLGEVFYSRVAFRITGKRGPEPDVAFVAKSRMHLVQTGFVAGPPDLALEIVSPDSVKRDYDTKRSIYEKSGVKEYWIIDPAERKATFLHRTRGQFRQLEPTANHFESKVLPGFRLDVRWLWSKRRPSAFHVLKKLLGE